MVWEAEGPEELSGEVEMLLVLGGMLAIEYTGLTWFPVTSGLTYPSSTYWDHQPKQSTSALPTGHCLWLQGTLLFGPFSYKRSMMLLSEIPSLMLHWESQWLHCLQTSQVLPMVPCEADSLSSQSCLCLFTCVPFRACIRNFLHIFFPQKIEPEVVPEHGILNGILEKNGWPQVGNEDSSVEGWRAWLVHGCRV